MVYSMTNDEAMAFPIVVLLIVAVMIFVMLAIVPSDKRGNK